MLIELCAGNYATHDGLFNGANGVFQYVTKLQKNESLIWIGFNNPKAISTTIIWNWNLYTTHIHETWTPIQPISKEIQIRKNSSHLITSTRYPIELATTRTIHWFQALTLDFLAFDPSGIHHHGLTYTTLSYVKENKFLFTCTFNWSKL
jgi:hypothetical protein